MTNHQPITMCAPGSSSWAEHFRKSTATLLCTAFTFSVSISLQLALSVCVCVRACVRACVCVCVQMSMNAWLVLTSAVRMHSVVTRTAHTPVHVGMVTLAMVQSAQVRCGAGIRFMHSFCFCILVGVQ